MDGEKAKILLVDDDKYICKIFKLILEDVGYRIEVAINANEAITVCEEGCIDLVILDYSLPGIPGEELAKRIRMLDKSIPIIFLSGFPLNMNSIDEPEVSGILVKPVHPDVLIKEIEKALT